MSNQAQLDPKNSKAISAALENNWTEALELNKQLLANYPNDVDTMNRLARALSETGSLSDAKKYYKKVLVIDPYNQIAEKNLKRLYSLKKSVLKDDKSTTSVKGDQFLQDPGKTIVTPLVDIAMPEVLAGLQVGDKLQLYPHRSEVTATSSSGERIGKIEGEVSQIVATNLRSGSKFETFVKSVSLKSKQSKDEKSQVSVFIRETHRSAKVLKAPFPSTTTAFIPYVREEALLLSNQAPVPTEAEDSIEEIEVSEIPGVVQEQPPEKLAESEEDDIEDQ